MAMTFNILKRYTLAILISIVVLSPARSFSEQEVSLLETTPQTREYAINTVKPVLDDLVKNPIPVTPAEVEV
jgi:hypothetical protein